MSEKQVIQVCTDGSELSQRAVNAAVRLAKDLGLPVLGMTSVVGGDAPANGLEGESAEIQERLSYIRQKAKALDVECILVAEHCPSASKGILSCAKKNNAKFIVMASRGLGSIGSLLLGSETQKTLAQADRPILVIR